MQPEDLIRALQNKAQEVEQYAASQFPTMAGNIALRFINGNFRAQGFQGTTFKKWKKSTGTILVKSGRLRNSTYFTAQSGQAIIRNHMPYAKAHNEGFKGTVRVKTHTRNIYRKTEISPGRWATYKSGESQVKAHTRKINLPQRQFIPTTSSPSPVLNNAIKRELTKDLIKIINS